MARRKPRHAKPKAPLAPGSQARLPTGSTPGGNGWARPDPLPMAGPDHLAGNGASSDAPAVLPLLDSFGGPGASAMPTSTGDAGDLPWPDHLTAALSGRAQPENSERRAAGGAPAGAGPAFPADAGTGDARGATEASVALPAESADVLAAERHAAVDGDRTDVVRDHEDTWRVPEMRVADMRALDLQVTDMRAPDLQVTDSGPDEPGMRARSVEGDKSAAGAEALVAAVAAAKVAGGSADTGRGRGSLRRSQWSARPDGPPDGPPTGDPGGQDEAGASPDEPVRRQVRWPALRAAVLVGALILGSVIVLMNQTSASTGAPGGPARHVAPAGHLQSPGVAGQGRKSRLAPLASINSAAVTPSPEPGSGR
jgi:hypothetical protein